MLQKASLDLKDDSTLLERGNYAHFSPNIPTPVAIKLVCYNIRWQHGQGLQRLIALLRDDKEMGAGQIIALQEVDRRKKRTGYVNTARLIAQELALNYAWTAAPSPSTKSFEKEQREEATGIAIFSPYPMAEVERIELPYGGPGGRRRVALAATIRIGEHNVRAYCVHAERRLSFDKHMGQLETVLDALARRSPNEHVVVMGDFNTAKRKDVHACIELFTARGFTTPLPYNRPTWKTSVLQFKLDWIWLRALQGTDYSIVRRVTLSDHFPVLVTVKF